jgi:hypothetical protein
MQNAVFADKSILTTLILATIVIFSLPLILPHITHEYMIYHVLLHMITMLIAVLLVIISSIAYYRSRSTRMLLMMVALIALSISEGINFLVSVDALRFTSVPLINTEIPHLLILLTLVFLLIGVLKVS